MHRSRRYSTRHAGNSNNSLPLLNPNVDLSQEFFRLLSLKEQETVSAEVSRHVVAELPSQENFASADVSKKKSFTAAHDSWGKNIYVIVQVHHTSTFHLNLLSIESGWIRQSQHKLLLLMWPTYRASVCAASLRRWHVFGLQLLSQVATRASGLLSLPFLLRDRRYLSHSHFHRLNLFHFPEYGLAKHLGPEFPSTSPYSVS